MPAHHKYLFAAIRRVWGWYGERKKAKSRAQIGPNMWRCEMCDARPLGQKERDVDHIVPCMPTSGWDGDWTGYINRMFCPADGLRVLCKTCHTFVTSGQATERATSKRETRK